MARACVEASGRGGVGGGSVRCCSGLRSNEPRFFSPGGGATGASDRRSGCSHELALSPACGGDPCALNMGRAIETSTFAASPTPSIGTIFLGLVSAILARSSPTTGTRSS